MEQGKVNAIIEGLRNLHDSSLPDWTIERIHQLCTVIPLDQPILFTFFWDYQADCAGAAGVFCDFLAETGTEHGACDSSPIDPVMLYERPDAEQEYHVYTADGSIYDEEYCFGGESGTSTWGDAIDPDGFEVKNYPNVTTSLVDALWDMANGDLQSLPEKLEKRDWCVRYYQQAADGYFEKEWSGETWDAFDAWCKKKGIENPYDGTEWG